MPFGTTSTSIEMSTELFSHSDQDASSGEPAELLKQYWGFDSLRPLQEQAVSASLEGRDCVVIMPTGGGKSLCYQLPPLVKGRLDVVVSPLISLMQDQIDSLKSLGYPAAQLNSSMPQSEQLKVQQAARAGELRLLMVSPEKMLTPGFLGLCQTARVRAIAIDEAHCISSWGHDFRPDYRQLSRLKEIFPTLPLMALTATATPQVQADITRQLRLNDPVELVGNFDRPNLTYRMLKKKKGSEVPQQIAEIIRRHQEEAVIIYCLSRKDTENTAEQLRLRGIDATFYHAGMETDERRQVVEDFRNERAQVVVATVAFGMGIDRSNVRCVIHMGMPRSIEAYQQETGRAGRDGLASECVLLYGDKDDKRWERLMRMSMDDAIESGGDAEALREQFERGKRQLATMAAYMHRPLCRHSQLVSHFGQALSHDNCGACDICLGEVKGVSDVTTPAQMVLSCVYRLYERMNRRVDEPLLLDVLRGELTPEIRNRGYDQLSTFGLMRDWQIKDLDHLIKQLDLQQWLWSEVSYGEKYFRLGPEAGDVLRGYVKVEIPKRGFMNLSVKSSAVDDWQGVDRDLFDALKEWRLAESQEREVPPYVLFNDRTLRELAREKPRSRAKLLNIHGIGRRKLEEFGDLLLEKIQAY